METLKLFEEEKSIELFSKGLSKSEIKERALSAVDHVLEEGNPLKVAESLNAMELFIKEVKEDARFKNYVREEATKEGKPYVSNSGCKIELAETGTKYDFSKCGDLVLQSLESEFETLKAKVKQRQDFLKNVPFEGIEILDKATGDMLVIYPPSKTSTSSYKITLSK